MNLLEVSGHFLVVGVLRIFQQHLAVTNDRVHRCAKFVAHIREKRTLGAVGVNGNFARRFEFLLRALALEDPSELPSDVADQAHQIFVRRHLDRREEFQHGHDVAPDRDGKSEGSLHAEIIDEFGSWKVWIGLDVFDPHRFAGF